MESILKDEKYLVQPFWFALSNEGITDDNLRYNKRIFLVLKNYSSQEQVVLLFKMCMVAFYKVFVGE